MSRNLSKTYCSFCEGDVKLVESKRPITPGDCGMYYDMHDGYSYAGGIVANAECVDCLAKYLAWIDFTSCAGYGSHSYLRWRPEDGREFFDLSFRQSFNDEPGEDDLPEHRIEVIVIRKKHAWPVCNACKKKIYSVYGCQCPIEGRETVEDFKARKLAEGLAAVEEQRRITQKCFEEYGKTMEASSALADKLIEATENLVSDLQKPLEIPKEKDWWKNGDFILTVLDWLLAERLAGRRPNDHIVSKQFSMTLEEAIDLHEHLEEIGELG